MTQDPLSATLFALADPTRRAILARLTDGDATVSELAAPFPMTFAAVSKHIKVLEQAGLVSRGREAQWRPCRLEAGPLRDLTEWLEAYRRFWDESVDRLEDYLRRLQDPDAGSPPTPKERKDPCPRSTPPRLASSCRRTTRSSCSTGWSTRRARRCSPCTPTRRIW